MAIMNSILYIIASDNMPLQTPENRGFRKFAATACPLFKIPSRKTLTRMMDAKYESLSYKVKITLANVQHLSLRTDCWTESKATKTYMALTVHYPLEGSPSIVSTSLGCFPLNESHTVLYLGTELQKLCTEWNISKSKITSFTTDNGSNVIKAIGDSFGESLRIPCFAHSLQLVPECAIKKTEKLIDILENVKKIVDYFKRSTVAAEELKQAQILAGKTVGMLLKLIQSVSTRWNLEYYMLDRFVLLENFVSTVLYKQCKNDKRNSIPKPLLPEELDVLKDVLHLLKLFEHVTTELCSEDVTSSKVLPLINCLNLSLESA